MNSMKEKGYSTSYIKNIMPKDMKSHINNWKAIEKGIELFIKEERTAILKASKRLISIKWKILLKMIHKKTNQSTSSETSTKSPPKYFRDAIVKNPNAPKIIVNALPKVSVWLCRKKMQ